jgi:hypothetical protein
MGVAAALLALAGCGAKQTTPGSPPDGGPNCSNDGFHWCSGSDGKSTCVNTRMDPNNCGGCGNVCPTTLPDGGMGNFAPACGEVMGVPTCGLVCNEGFSACSTSPIQTCTYDFSTGDPEAIPIGDVSAAPDLFVQCSAVCADLANDPNNCGQCGSSCLTTCVGGVCQ